MNPRPFLASLFALLFPFIGSACWHRDSDPAPTADPSPAAKATNEFGLNVFRRLARADENFCISPYSIETALAMTYAGVDGATRQEMMEVLHLPSDDGVVHDSFNALRHRLEELARNSEKLASERKKEGRELERFAKQNPPSALGLKKYVGSSEPITLTIANHILVQKGFDFHETFLGILKKRYVASIEPVDFVKDANRAVQRINTRMADQTHQQIKGVVPADAVNPDTRAIIANAVYLKAAWDKPFDPAATESLPFHVRVDEKVNVPTMQTHPEHPNCGYIKHDDFVAVSIPYLDPSLRFLVLLPDAAGGLPALEARITSTMLTGFTNIDEKTVSLYFPKFRFAPATLRLKSILRDLGMATAFGEQANFDRMTHLRPNGLYLSEVLHKTLVAIDERGTEAGAATAAMEGWLGEGESDLIEVRVDRPFFYAIQHVPTGACLFMGHVIDPR